jgi:hypothetical protein
MSYLYTPPTWRLVGQIEKALRYGVVRPTVVYRVGGVWHSLQEPGIGNPDVTTVDVANGQLLYFDRPTVVPDSLFAELSAIVPANPAWFPATFVHQ